MPVDLLSETGGPSHLPGDLANLIVENAGDSIFVMDTEGRTLFANAAAERTFGWAQDELRGRSLHDMVHYKHSDGRHFPMSECPLGHVFTSRHRLEKHEDLFFHRDGMPIHVACSNAPVLRDGEMIGAVLIAVDITERKRIQEQLAEALAAKQALIQEAHHRVKNSLMMVLNLLRLQAHQVPDETVRQHFDEACSRIAIAARLHERLHGIEDAETVEFASVLREVCADIHGTSPAAERVALAVEAVPMVLPADRALPLALLTNELVTNAIKHAFPQGRAGRIQVRFGPAGDGTETAGPGAGWELRVCDDGAGLPEDFDSAAPRSLGMRLVTALAGQIGASLTIEREPETAFVLRAE
ncbi:PAS domain S-box protein [Azospirillum sp. SYSU D00513]|uniref:PAS domain-containing sensor histidine kinase n=1 Tax=Azospirillum sp. SYSU D00513 TaxID=2812561 RepID=UPI001A969BDE|nr:PAS domain S-box protein [Azospirillum sp. SYSU D00513]